MSKLTPVPLPIKGKDIKLVVGEATISNIKQALSQRAKMLGKVRTYEFRGSSAYLNRGNFVDPVYDLAEISRVLDIEPYIAQSVRKQREQVLKEGYKLIGTDEVMVQYVKNRLFEIALLTEIPTEQWLRDLTNNLITFHNGFLVLRRDENRSSGASINYFGKQLAPIAGIFVGDPTSMQVKVDKYGTVKKWAQKIISDAGVPAEKEFATEDVIHIPVDRKPGYTFGTPYILPVLDDIRALRKLEELAITVIGKEAFPLMHYKVGTPEHPAIVYDGGGNEVDSVLEQVTSMPAQGYIVTSERHEISLISKQGAIIDMAPYITYFESRVMAGLRLSPLDLGRGSSANRGTATNINQNLQDSAKDYQTMMADMLTHRLILPLLMEGGFDITPENLVRFSFETINKEEERASQNHGLQLFMSNAITLSEFRQKHLNIAPLSEEEKADLNLAQQTEAQIKVVKSKPVAAGSGGSSTASLSNTGVKAQVGNRAKPANQYGAKPKTKFTANDYKSSINNLITDLKTDLLGISDLSEESIVSTIDSKLVIFADLFSETIQQRIVEATAEGVKKAESDFERLFPDTDFAKQEIGRRSLDRFFTNFVSKSIWKTLSPHKESIYDKYKRDAEGNTCQIKVVSVIEDIRKDILELVDVQIITAQRFGYIKFAKRMGHKYIEVLDLNNSTTSSIDISNIIYKTFIPKDSKENAILKFLKEPTKDE